MASTGGVSPPSLLALLGSRCRKRPCYFDDEEGQQETSPPRKITTSDRVCASESLLVTHSGSFRENGANPASFSTSVTSKKRAREDTAGAQQDIAKLVTHKDDEDDDEDGLCTFNSFQYWRVPLPELDLSLLQNDTVSEPNSERPIKDSSVAMES